MTTIIHVSQDSTHAAHPLRASLVFAIVTLLLFGLMYSFLGTGMGRTLFPHAATGSLTERSGKVVGSSLIAQPFGADRYFHPRPSASNYDPMAMSGSNQARSNPDMRKRIEESRAAIAAREGVAPDAVPSDLMTQSGSGGDPHISPEAARIQIERVANARGLSHAQVGEIVTRYTEGPQFGLFGQPRINVLALNFALDTFIISSGAK